MRHILSILSVVIVFALTSCDGPTTTSNEEVVNSFDYSGTIVENIQTSKYTYCLVKTDKNEHWVAVSKMEVENGKTLYFNQGIEMRDFHSKELDRDFPSVFFVQSASLDPTSGASNKTMPMQQQKQTMQKPEIVKEEIAVDKAVGGISIAELFANSAKYSGKKVIVRGKVIKFSPSIMNRNWVHIQDGTEHEGNFDLTITTAEMVNVGAVVSFEGTVALNKDFGAGYSYSLIMEESKVVK
jgi:hypothetical protein